MTPVDPNELPGRCAVAFKEWAGVCDALLGGRQALILRKGGIEEVSGEFRPEHDVFWLYPTRVHQAQQGLKPGAWTEPPPPPAAAGPVVEIRGLAVVERVTRVDRPERLAALEDLHVWNSETVEARFNYRRPGLWVLAVRVYRRGEPHRLPATPEHAGCKTWIPLEPGLSTAGLEPAIGSTRFGELMARLDAALPGGDGR